MPELEVPLLLDVSPLLEVPPVLELLSVVVGVELLGFVVVEESGGVLLLPPVFVGEVGSVVVGSSRDVVPVGVPGGTTVPGGIGLPGGRVTGASEEPGGGTSVMVGLPSGPMLTTAVGELDSGIATPLTVIVPGTALPGITCVPFAAFPLVALALSVVAEEGEASSAIPPNAVASTTPLAASRTYPLRFTRDAGSRGGDTSVR
ncbi:hypothetical protein FPZ12_045390 [Amycolatopsis acidicola]|uniref:Uncharacterized protein n=1 Tax=Amycolatopsis acidicola TaxID=2596893 RepID=A0A5N0UGK7_9PSEU|nr:hypothetical protein [Amycolatopsis acidicola]KAA9147393.1 hypothetical protein FPZ12_045390 [Amycolatopsis acidicola]